MAVFSFTADDYRQRTTISLKKVDRVLTDDHAGSNFLTVTIDGHLQWIYSQLSKRYSVPFDEADAPDVLKVWLTRLTDLDVWLSIYQNPDGAEFDLYQRRAQTTETEVQAAANGESGLFEFVKNQQTQVSKGGPISYSVASYQLVQRQQARRARQEEQDDLGTYRK